MKIKGFENDTYYEPELKDFYLGYECFILTDNGVKFGCFPDLLLYNSELDQYKEDYNKAVHAVLKTKYLDKQDLENEGWIDEGGLFFKLKTDKTERWYLSFYPEQHRIEFCDNNSEFGFTGTVKSVNEFRNIIKYLGI